MKKENKYSVWQFIGDLAHYASPYKKKFFVGAFFRLTSDLAQLYPAWAISRIVLILSKPGITASSKELVTTFILWGLATLYFGFAHNLSKYFGYQVAENASLDIYKETLAHIFKLDFAWQERENSGNKMKRIDRGLDGVNVTIRRIFDVLIEVAVNTIGIVIIFFTLDRVLGISIVIFMATYYLFSTLLLKKAMRQERIVNKAFENLGGVTFEALNNIQTIKSLSIDEGINKVVTRHISLLVQKIKRRIFLYQSQNGAQLMYESLFLFGVVAFLTWGILHGTQDVGLLVLFIGLFGKVSTSTDELTDVTQQIALARIWVSRSMEILRTQPNIENPEKVALQKSYSPDWKEIKIDKVKFAYGKKEALQEISLVIKRGEKVGIVGLSGAGKSTLFKLLLDLYEDYEGEILIDGIPLKNLRRQSFIDHVSVVLQDTELFDMSLRDNIEIAAVSWGYKDPDLKDVIHMAHLDEVVAQLVHGLDTIVGEKGIRLSGGQSAKSGNCACALSPTRHTSYG